MKYKNTKHIKNKTHTTKVRKYLKTLEKSGKSTLFIQRLNLERELESIPPHDGRRVMIGVCQWGRYIIVIGGAGRDVQPTVRPTMMNEARSFKHTLQHRVQRLPASPILFSSACITPRETSDLRRCRRCSWGKIARNTSGSLRIACSEPLY